MAPTRSMKCMSRPPSRLPSVLASLGKTSSVISDREPATLRGGSKESVDSICLSVYKCAHECKPRRAVRRQQQPQLSPLRSQEGIVAKRRYDLSTWTKLRCLRRSWHKTREMPLRGTDWQWNTPTRARQMPPWRNSTDCFPHTPITPRDISWQHKL